MPDYIRNVQKNDCLQSTILRIPFFRSVIFLKKNISKVENVFPSNLLISFLVFLRVSSGSIFRGTAFFIRPLIREKSQTF